jgi:hydroxymethylpyrimidine pyrophosphatase-like HAD family hydrolase
MARMLKETLVVAVDFDGTISTEPHMGHELVLQPNCKEVLNRLHDKGVKLILWTCRTGKALDEAIEFLAHEEIFHLFSVTNQQLPEIEELYQPDVARKVGADYYIDDKNLFTKIDWLEIEKQLTNVLEEV